MMSKELRLPLKQHIGAPAVPAVKQGERVRKGQVLGQCQGLGADLHASVSGVVREINEHCIILDADETQPADFELLPAGLGIAEAGQAAGLVGMGGAGFPSHVKLAADLKGQGALIANGVECEPLLAHNILQLCEEPERIRRGMLLAMEATHAGRGILAVKNKHQNAMEAFRAVLQPGDSIEIFPLPDLYPMGEDRKSVV